MINQRDVMGFAYPVKAAVVMFQNLMMSMSDPERTRKAMEAMDFVMCVDTHMSETALWADVVIPGANYLERYDINPRWVTFRAISLRQPVVKSWIPGGRSEAQFFMDLGGALGLAGFKSTPEYTTDEGLRQKGWANFMAKGWTNQMTWPQFKAAGLWMEDFSVAKGGTHYEKWKKTATGKAYDAATMEVVAFGPAGDQVFTVRNKTSHAVIGFATSLTPTTYDEAPGLFATPSGKFQFWDPYFNDAYVGNVYPGGANVTGDVRFHPLPAFQYQEQVPTPSFPLFFVSWKEVEHTHSRTQNNEWLMEMKGSNRLWIHPTAAAARGIEEEDVVYVQGPYGVVKARAHVTVGIHANTVGFARGFGHWALGRVAKGKGTHEGWLMPPRAEVHSAQLPHKDMVCQVTKA
jgi:thiosulfate reductase/polysulfide reductase chain A